MKKILLIGYEPIMLQCLKNVLAYEGYESQSAVDYTKALEVLRGEEINLLIVDLLYGNDRGFDFYRESRKQKKVSSLFTTAFPEIFNTRSKQLCDVWTTEFIEGTTDILYMPFDLSLLTEKIESLIGPPA